MNRLSIKIILVILAFGLILFSFSYTIKVEKALIAGASKTPTKVLNVPYYAKGGILYYTTQEQIEKFQQSLDNFFLSMLPFAFIVIYLKWDSLKIESSLDKKKIDYLS